jgi:mutator protein MutT
LQTLTIPCVAAILYNTNRHVLLMQRDEKPGLEFPGWWTLPGGRMEAGETPQAAIERELREEIEVVPDVTLWRVYERPHHRLIFGQAVVIEQYVYAGQVDLRAAEITVNEGQAIRYFGIAEFAELRIAYGFDALLREFLQTI